MNTVILYDSLTGNTAYLAQKLAEHRPGIACGKAGELSISDADRVFLGFWTDKGGISDNLRKILPELSGKEIFLFGTAGFGKNEEYFAQIIDRVKKELPASCQVIGWYMCAGRMGDNVRRRYEAMLENPDTREKGKMLLENFKAVLSHPNQQDVDQLEEKIREIDW